MTRDITHCMGRGCKPAIRKQCLSYIQGIAVKLIKPDMPISWIADCQPYDKPLDPDNPPLFLPSQKEVRIRDDAPKPRKVKVQNKPKAKQ